MRIVKCIGLLTFVITILSAEWWEADPTDQDYAYFGGNREEDAFPGNEVGKGDFNGDGHMDIIIGAPGWNGVDAGEGENEGRVYVYYSSASGLPDGNSPSWFADPTDEALFDPEDQNFGVSVGVGDINNDSYDDLVIGAYRFKANSTAPVEGAIYVYYGSSSGLPSEPNDPSNYQRRDPTDENNTYFGYSVALGDFNNDNYDDVAVGTPLKDVEENSDNGVVYIYYGGSDGLSSTYTIINSPSSQSSDLFGYALSAGDINGDGICDLVVSAPGWDELGVPATQVGKVYIFHGSEDGINTSPDVTINPPVDPSDGSLLFGWKVVVGDVNGSGNDLIISASYYDNTFANEGGTFIYYNSSWSSPSVTLDPTNEEDGRFGFSLGIGDVEEDGFRDIIVGAPFTNQGKVYIYKGGSSGLSTTPACVFDPVDSPTGPLYFGWSVGFAGDVDNNGEENVIISMPFWNGEETIDEGRVYVNLGSLPIEVKVDKFWYEIEARGIKICWKVVGEGGVILMKKEEGKRWQRIFRGIGKEVEFVVDEEVEEGKEYWYKLEDDEGEFSESLKVHFPVRRRKIIINSLRNKIQIRCYLGNKEEIGIKIYDVLGREIFSIRKKRNNEEFLFPVNSGIYFINLSLKREKISRKIVVF